MDHEKEEAYTKEANLLIDSLIKNSFKEYVGIQDIRDVSINDIYCICDKVKANWMTIDEFSIDNGKTKIEEFILTWGISCNFLYCIEFVSEDAKIYSKRFMYKVQWSIPTRRKPIPRATASVYFIIEVSTVKPKNFPVNVYFVFETNSVVNRPGDPLLYEKWLKDIIESKTLLWDTIKF